MKTKTRSRELRYSSHYLGTVISRGQEKLYDAQSFENFLKPILKKADVTNLGVLFHEFENHSFTLVVMLAESHISIHTWPERFAVQLDVFLCNYIHDNTEKCKMIFQEIVEYFDPVELNVSRIERI